MTWRRRAGAVGTSVLLLLLGAGWTSPASADGPTCYVEGTRETPTVTCLDFAEMPTQNTVSMHPAGSGHWIAWWEPASFTGTAARFTVGGTYNLGSNSTWPAGQVLFGNPVVTTPAVVAGSPPEPSPSPSPSPEPSPSPTSLEPSPPASSSSPPVTDEQFARLEATTQLGFALLVFFAAAGFVHSWQLGKGQ